MIFKILLILTYYHRFEKNNRVYLNKVISIFWYQYYYWETIFEKIKYLFIRREY
jgi:hypothetical protein